MYFLSAESIREMDRLAIADGISGVELMGRAARLLAREILFLMEERKRPVRILAGPGNNGGDGFGVALHLHHAGVPVEIWVAAERERVRGEASAFLIAAEACGIVPSFLPEPSDWTAPHPFASSPALLIDALLGTGSHGEPQGAIAAAIEWLRQAAAECPVIAIDIPSGLDANTGYPHHPERCVRADVTLTLGAAKTGFLLDASAEWTGSVTVLDLGFAERQIASRSTSEWRVMTPTLARRLLRPREADDHKGRFGHVHVLGGSPGMGGAVALAGMAALRCGSGLVTICAPAPCRTAVARFPELMFLEGVTGPAGTLRGQVFDFRRADAIALGPGMGVDNDTVDFTRRILRQCPLPLVLDASALGTLAALEDVWGHVACPHVLTPHPGELAKLLGISAQEVQAERARRLVDAVTKFQTPVLLKGSHTRMALPAGQRWINLNGNPGMATAGSGDVLSGILTSLLGQGVPMADAIPLAAFLHGRAGDLACWRRGAAGMTAMDILEALPAVLRDLQGR